VRFDLVLFGPVGLALAQFGSIWFSLVKSGLDRFGVVGFGSV